MTPEERYTAAWLAEMWPTTPEVPYGDRVAKRTEDRRSQRQLEELDALSAVRPVAGAA